MENALTLDAKCTFAYAYFWFRALESVGLYDHSDTMMDRLRALPALGCTTIPETPDAPRSDCHAWGAIAIYEFAAVILGVHTVDAAKKRIRIAPRIDGRHHAYGTVYTGIGGGRRRKGNLPAGRSVIHLSGGRHHLYLHHLTKKFP